MRNLDDVLKSRDITLPTKVHLVKTMVFPVVMYACESWTAKRLRTKELMLSNCGAGKIPEIPLDCKEIKSVNPKRNQPWIFSGRILAEAEVPTLWPPDAKSRLTGKDSDARKEWRQKEKGVRGWDGYIVSLNSMDMNLNKLQETLKDREAFAVHGVTKNHDLATE